MKYYVATAKCETHEVIKRGVRALTHVSAFSFLCFAHGRFSNLAVVRICFCANGFPENKFETAVRVTNQPSNRQASDLMQRDGTVGLDSVSCYYACATVIAIIQ